MGLVIMLRKIFIRKVLILCSTFMLSALHSEASIGDYSEPHKNKVYINACDLPYIACIEGGIERKISETNTRPIVFGYFAMIGKNSYVLSNSDTNSPEIAKLDLRGSYLISGFRFLMYENANFSGWYGGLVMAMLWHETALSEKEPCKDCTLVDAGRIQRYFRPTAGLEAGYAFTGEKWVVTIGLRFLLAEKDSASYIVNKGGQNIAATTEIKTSSYPFFDMLNLSFGYMF